MKLKLDLDRSHKIETPGKALGLFIGAGAGAGAALPLSVELSIPVMAWFDKFDEEVIQALILPDGRKLNLDEARGQLRVQLLQFDVQYNNLLKLVAAMAQDLYGTQH